MLTVTPIPRQMSLPHHYIKQSIACKSGTQYYIIRRVSQTLRHVQGWQKLSDGSIIEHGYHFLLHVPQQQFVSYSAYHYGMAVGEAFHGLDGPVYQPQQRKLMERWQQRHPILLTTCCETALPTGQACIDAGSLQERYAFFDMYAIFIKR